MDRQGDLTRGSILSTLMRYAAPFIVSNVLQATYNITDMIIAGQFGGSSYAQSAIGNCTTVTTLLTQIIIGLATGGSILIGQYFGARKERECRQSTVTLFTMRHVWVGACSVMSNSSGPLELLCPWDFPLKNTGKC